MTEQEWNDCTDPERMLVFLRGKASERKLRLFACHCCRRFWRFVGEEGYRGALEATERFADGAAGAEELETAYGACPFTAGRGHAVFRAAWVKPGETAMHAAIRTAAAAVRAGGGSAFLHHTVHASFLRDLLGPLPFRPVSLDPAWLAWHGGAVGRLARAVYEKRERPSGHLDTGRLAVLADMLEEAGCTDADLLGHLRSPGPHVRGCHVLDALTGKK